MGHVSSVWGVGSSALGTVAQWSWQSQRTGLSIEMSQTKINADRCFKTLSFSSLSVRLLDEALMKSLL